jgi:hypothetical protein
MLVNGVYVIWAAKMEKEIYFNLDALNKCVGNILNTE